MYDDLNIKTQPALFLISPIALKHAIIQVLYVLTTQKDINNNMTYLCITKLYVHRMMMV